jgi:hypothetical protein
VGQGDGISLVCSERTLGSPACRERSADATCPAMGYSSPCQFVAGITEVDVLSDRRGFLKRLTAAAAGSFLLAEPYRSLAATMRKKVKIRNVKCMIVRGTWDWNLIKVYNKN